MPQPLVSLVMVTYKQAPFVRQAVRSALSQDYGPLEIIISDDCSPDDTYQEIQRELQDNPTAHKVILHQTRKNVGLAGNLNDAFALASGELMVVQAGDDLSLPQRTRVLVDAWETQGRPDMLCSDLMVIDNDGKVVRERWGKKLVRVSSVEEVAATGMCGVMGCACAYARRIYTRYGDIPPQVLQEDAVLPFRAMLESRLCVVDQALVQYRLHDGNLFFGKKTRRRSKLPREKAGRWAHSDLAIAQDWLRCWDLSGRQDDALRQRLARFVQWRQLDLDGYARSRLGGIGVALKSRAAGLPLRESGGVFRRHVLRF